jgi:hypothetical protein
MRTIQDSYLTAINHLKNQALALIILTNMF